MYSILVTPCWGARRDRSIEPTSPGAKESSPHPPRPITDDVRKWKLTGMGALAVIGIGAALGVPIADVVKRGLAILLRGR
ncbi:DUF1515 family protein [Bradyrhizobium sp. BRP14]|nr:DUF1515 family protein [Bradyrhizobium sp. BRP14]